MSDDPSDRQTSTDAGTDADTAHTGDTAVSDSVDDGMASKDTSMENIEARVERVEEIKTRLQEADSMNPAEAKRLRDEALELLDVLETQLDVGDGDIDRN